MKNKNFIILTTIFLLVIFFTQSKLASQPVRDNDEGIYLTSFLLVDRGNPAYKKTYFSQPPGFLLSVYPGFTLLGKSLQSSRLTIGIWSLIGLVAILWISYELKNKWAGLLTISLLYLIPSYYNQILTLQSDILVSTFSLLSLATLIRFTKSLRLPWFILSVLMLNLAFWTKFDITFLPSFVVTLWFIKKQNKIFNNQIINLLIIFFAVSLAFFILFILPFGIREVFNNSILLRLQAAATSTFLFSILGYLKKDVILSLIIFSSLILSIFKKNKFGYHQKIIFIWSIFILIILIFYRPLFSHHLVILAVPMVLLFSQSVSLYFSNKKLFRFLILIILIISLSNRINIMIKTSSKLINDQQQNAVEIIKKYTSIDDIVVSDEEILNGLSGRLPPPELSDISYVRIRSDNLSPENFSEIIKTYKPKLIIPWNGRLESIKNFKENLSSYKILTSISTSKNIYIRIDK